ncbi:phosphate/phosphite/phosphonate ABC transporter substrate-binding protein [Anaerobacillus sp. CMMVII]|uniref:substrate-binding domain-containing protein n=1 Tax=Anaerobacillus sp. CMMVII TaxID=2755588 RepID=UPI0021B7E538|nr:phosphate/phosphite/phosphonate ABC transporter substrate-binding protein [Anaerobacillus sp. CMMVII]MCT8137418.1 phosphate/phosphite/phosphonate ABC transporter substrate-binding protein [Anaerobacillus sp. CMMVII]
MQYIKLIFIIVIFGFLISISIACSVKAPETVIALTEASLVDSEDESLNHDEETLKFAIVSILSIRETHRTFHKFAQYLEEELGRPVEIIQKQTYTEVKELFERDEIDAGIVCAYLSVVGRREGIIKKIAMPVIDGEKQFTSYIITKNNSSINSMEDLYGKNFAYSDSLSYSGYLVAKYNIVQGGFDFNSYFSNAYYTYSHDNTILAVANGLVDAGATHSVVFDKLKKENNPIIAEIKIIAEGELVGHSPVVINPNIDPDLEIKLREVILSMHKDEKGRKALEKLGYDYFDVPDKDLFKPIIKMLKDLGDL